MWKKVKKCIGGGNGRTASPFPQVSLAGKYGYYLRFNKTATALLAQIGERYVDVFIDGDRVAVVPKPEGEFKLTLTKGTKGYSQCNVACGWVPNHKAEMKNRRCVWSGRMGGLLFSGPELMKTK